MKFKFYSILNLTLLAVVASVSIANAQVKPRILVFKKTAGYHHASIPLAALAIMKLGQENAQGYMGGYVDVDSWYTHSNKTRDTAHQAYGNTSGPSLYRALRKLADAYPDPKTGQNTAISSALNVRFTQVFVKHSDANVAMETGTPAETRTASAKATVIREGSR